MKGFNMNKRIIYYLEELISVLTDNRDDIIDLIEMQSISCDSDRISNQKMIADYNKQILEIEQIIQKLERV